MAQDRPFDRVLIDPADELHVDFHDVRLIPGQQREAGVAGPEIVDGGPEADLLVGRHDVQDVSDIELLGLGELEDDAVQREAGPLRRVQCQAYAGLGLVDGVRQEVDRQARAVFRKLKGGRELDRLDPALLVEGIAIRLVHGRQDRVRALSVRPTDQGFVGENLPGRDVDYGLERHRKGLGEAGTIAASLASGRHDCDLLRPQPI